MSVVGGRSRTPGWVRRWLVLALAAAIAVLCGGTAARADCTLVIATVTCTGTTTNYQPGVINGVTINIVTGASVVGGAGGTEAIFTTNATNSFVNNFGTINGPVSFVGAGNTFTNAGYFTITDPAANLLGHSISGDYVQTAAGTLVLRFDANTFFDQLVVTAGTATLNGKLIVVAQPGLYTTAFTNDFVAGIVGGTVAGQFSSVTSSSPFFSVTTAYTATKVNVTLTPIAFNAVPGLTPNQQAVANALQANYSAGVTGNAQTLYQNLYAATSVSVFDQLSGAGLSAAQGAAFGAGTMFTGLIGPNPFSGGGGGTGGGLGYASADPHPVDGIIKLKQPEPSRWQAWGRGFGGTRSTAADASLGTFADRVSAAGGAFGVTYRPDADTQLGAAVGASRSNFSVNDLATSGHATAGHFGLNAARRWGAFYASGTLAYARIDNDTTRSITGVGPSETATGSFTSDMLTARLEAGWRQEFASLALTPFAAAQFSELWQQSFAETSSVGGGGGGGVLGLSYARQSVQSLPVTLGAQADTRIDLGNGRFAVPYARLGWLHEFKPDRTVTASFISVPGASFTVAGARAARDAAVFDGGIRIALNERTAVEASFDSETGNGSHSYAGTGTVRVNW